MIISNLPIQLRCESFCVATTVLYDAQFFGCKLNYFIYMIYCARID